MILIGKFDHKVLIFNNHQNLTNALVTELCSGDAPAGKACPASCAQGLWLLLAESCVVFTINFPTSIGPVLEPVQYREGSSSELIVTARATLGKRELALLVRHRAQLGDES
jgi:hypothetical protein